MVSRGKGQQTLRKNKERIKGVRGLAKTAATRVSMIDQLSTAKDIHDDLIRVTRNREPDTLNIFKPKTPRPYHHGQHRYCFRCADYLRRRQKEKERRAIIKVMNR